MFLFTLAGHALFTFLNLELMHPESTFQIRVIEQLKWCKGCKIYGFVFECWVRAGGPFIHYFLCGLLAEIMRRQQFYTNSDCVTREDFIG